MAQKQAAPEGIRKPTILDITRAVKRGASAQHFKVWQHGQSESAITAIWRNEIGPAHTDAQKVTS